MSICKTILSPENKARFLTRGNISALLLAMALSMLSGCGAPESSAPGQDLKNVKALIARGEYPEAFLKLNQALSKAPKDPEIHRNLAWLYLYTDDLPHARRELAELERLTPDHAETFRLRGALRQYSARYTEEKALAKREYEAAVADFRKALARDPKNHRTYFDLATSLSALDRPEEALEALDQGFDHIPRQDLDTQVDFEIASCDAHARLKMFDEAIADCRQALEFAADPATRERIEDMVESMKLLQHSKETP